jgi:hypothetical protein
VHQRIVSTSPPNVTITQEAIARYVDPDDNGSFITGTEGSFADDVAPYNLSQAGPKFSNGHDGTDDEIFVAYTRAIGSGPSLAAGLRKYNAAQPGCTFSAALCFPDGLSFNGQVPDTPDIDDTARAFVYTTEEESLDYDAQAIYNFQDADTPAENGLRWAVARDWLPGGSEGEYGFDHDTVRWGRLQELRTGSGAGDRVLKAVTTYRPGIGPFNQVFLIDAADPDGVAQIQVTSGAGIKFAPFLFFHEGLDTNMVVFREAPSLVPTQADIVVWKQDFPGSATWEEFMRITAADIDESGITGRNYLLSPEAFAYLGSTWVIFSSSDDIEVAAQSDGNVWIARVPDNPEDDLAYLRLNSRETGAEARSRFEGEVYFPNSGVPVFFYSQLITNADTRCTFYAGARLRNSELRRVTLSSPNELP